MAAAGFRTGEMIQLVRKDVILPKHKGQSAIIFLRDTKTAHRNILTSEKVLKAGRGNFGLCSGHEI